MQRAQLTTYSANLSNSIALLKGAKSFLIYEARITYCSNVWNGGNRTHIEKLYKMQKKAARIITETTYVIRSGEILGWESIEDTHTKRDSLTVFKPLEVIFKNTYQKS